MTDKQIPPQPTPPPCRLECSTCGYIAPEPEFNKKHPYCKMGILIWVVIGTGMLMFIASVVGTLAQGIGLINI